MVGGGGGGAVVVVVVVAVVAAAKVGRLKTKEAAIMMPKSIERTSGTNSSHLICN